MNLKIEYGRISKNGVVIGYATFVKDGDTIELFSFPFRGLHVRINGKICFKPDNIPFEYSMIWAQVAYFSRT
ncbi:MAG: hypothetical protein ACFFBD_20275 [Candidatus Hodarchaeota archaeon]